MSLSQPERASGAEDGAPEGAHAPHPAPGIEGGAGSGGPDAAQGWREVEEKGSAFGMRLLLGSVALFGRRGGRLLLWPIAAYYVVSHPDVRRFSRRYLRRIGEPDGLLDVYRHVLTFARCTLDRLFFLKGETERFDVRLHGHERVIEAAEAGRGAVFLGAHLGSFEAMRALSARWQVPVNVVMNQANARRFRRLVRSMDSGGGVHILEASGDQVALALEMREAVDRGEIVAILGDRVSAEERSVRAPFLGAEARFPAGPYLVAAALRCPVFLTFGLYRGGARYDLYCEVFADGLVLPRPREEALERCALRYAEALGRYCRMEPMNWFNFYDFWGQDAV